MPDTDQPMLIIRASYRGATPEDMDELVTKPIEDQASRLEGRKEHVLDLERGKCDDHAGV